MAQRSRRLPKAPVTSLYDLSSASSGTTKNRELLLP